MKEDLLKIINNYGVSNQLKKMSEEVFELQEAIIDAEYNRYVGVIRKPGEKAIEHIEEEFADCCVVLEQFKAYYDLDNDKIIEIMKKKINRQLKRIEREKEEENYN